MDFRMSTRDLLVPVTTEDHVEGPDNATVTLVDYADDECPYGRRADHAIKGLRRILDDQLRVVYRNFLLRDIRRHPQHGAQAAEAAARQGKFWPMRDVLFAHQDGVPAGHDLGDRSPVSDTILADERSNLVNGVVSAREGTTDGVDIRSHS